MESAVGIVGANGAGKSTLLFHLNGYLAPLQNRNRAHRRLPINQRKRYSSVRRTVGMVFQDPDDQLFMPMVYEDVAFGPLNLRSAGQKVDARVMRRAGRTVGA